MKVIVGKNKEEFGILLDKANRHGIITGASGSGKTVSLKVMAEGFSDAGVPVFFADVKGDLAGCINPGEETDSIKERLDNLDIKDFEFKGYPVTFWDIFGKKGHPIRARVCDVGSSILSMMLGLTDAQEGVLEIVFRVAQDEGYALFDLKDLKSLLQYVGMNKDEYILKYGNIATQSIGVIQRSLLTLESQGADFFFGEPNIDINDFIKTSDGKGMINILDAVELFKSPDLYTSFLLWILTELFNDMPEVGDLDKPKIVFFFDEAHLLFNKMPDYRLKQITQVVKLIRSRGIGLYFVSQSPLDIPDCISTQLGNRIQHTLRAYTPAEQRNVDAAADSFRTNPEFDTKKAILELGTGEALVSFQNEKGEPSIVEKVIILPPHSQLGTIDDLSRNKVINTSLVVGKYDEIVDNESAYEIITKKIEDDKQKKIKEQEEKVKEQKKKEEERQKAKKEREKEQKRKKDPKYIVLRKIKNAALNKVINKGLNTIMKKIFK